MDRSLQTDIFNLKKIPKDLSGIYIDAKKFQIPACLAGSRCDPARNLEPTIYHRRQKLNLTRCGGARISDGESDKREKRGLAAWHSHFDVDLSHPEGPLTPDALRHALLVEVGSPNLNSDNIPSIRALLANFQGPIIVDKEASTAQLTPSGVPSGSCRAFW